MVVPMVMPLTATASLMCPAGLRWELGVATRGDTLFWQHSKTRQKQDGELDCNRPWVSSLVALSRVSGDATQSVG